MCVGYYFERKRAFATGVAVCGSGVGTLVFAQIAEALLKVLSWKQVNLIYAGLVLMCGVSSCWCNLYLCKYTLMID